MKYLLPSLVFCSLAWGQHSEQPQKESTADLRTNTLLFSVEDTNTGDAFYLERSPGLSHFLRYVGKKAEKMTKLDGREAQKIDQDFAARFLKLQYEIPDVEGDCQVTLRLNMKGEKQEICQKDDKKTQEIAPVLSELSKRF